MSVCLKTFLKGGPKRDNDGISNVGAPVYIAVARQYVLVARGKESGGDGSYGGNMYFSTKKCKS